MPYSDPKQRKEYQRKYHKEWHARNNETRKQKIKKRKRALKQKYQSYKETLICVRCGFEGKGNPWAIELHHKDPKTKSELVSYLVSHGYSWERVKEEIEKCEPICANCHRKEHYLEYQFHPERSGSQKPLKRGDPGYGQRRKKKASRQAINDRRDYIAPADVRPGPKSPRHEEE
jgi:hypothetical protein